MKSLIIVSFLLLLFGNAHAQKLYSIQFDDEAGYRYNCLMIYYSPDDCHMRISTKVNGKPKLIDVEYNCKPVSGTNQDGEKYFVMKGEPTAEFVGCEPVGNYTPDCFIWYTKPDGTVVGPYVTLDNIRYTNQRLVKKYFLIDPNTVKESYLLQFFLPDEDEYFDLRLVCGLDKSEERYIPPVFKVPTLHFVSVANTLDKKIGISCRQDQLNLEEELSAVARTLGIYYKPYLIKDNGLQKGNVTAQLNALKPGPDDIVVFNYSGHGSRWDDQKDVYPLMDLWITPPFSNQPKSQAELEQIKQTIGQNVMQVSEVYNNIIRKGARLNIVLGDLCNNAIGVPKPIGDEVYLDDGHRSGFNFIIRDTIRLKKLFMETKGNLLSVAAKPDELASGNKNGGYFTTSFIEALQREVSYRSNSNSWDNIIKQTLDHALVYRKKSNPSEVQSGLRFLRLDGISKN